MEWDKNEHRCPICGEAFKDDDLCISDVELGVCHYDHYNPEGPWFDMHTGEELGPDNERPKPFPYSPYGESPDNSDK